MLAKTATLFLLALSASAFPLLDTNAAGCSATTDAAAIKSAGDKCKADFTTLQAAIEKFTSIFQGSDVINAGNALKADMAAVKVALDCSQPKPLLVLGSASVLAAAGDLKLAADACLDTIKGKKHTIDNIGWGITGQVCSTLGDMEGQVTDYTTSLNNALVQADQLAAKALIDKLLAKYGDVKKTYCG